MSSAEINDVFQIKVVIDADASAGISVTVPRALDILNITVDATAAAVGETLAFTTPAGVPTGAIACAAANTITSAASINPTAAAMTTGQSLDIVASAATVRGIVVLYCTASGAALTVA